MRLSVAVVVMVASLPGSMAQTVVGRYDSSDAVQYVLHPDGDIVYIADGAFGVRVVDVTNVPNAANPSSATTLLSTISGFYAKAVVMDNDYLYIIGTAGILYKYDTLNAKSSPIKTGESAPDSKGSATAVVMMPGGSVVYTCHLLGISQYDITGAAPVAISGGPTVTECHDMVVDPLKERLYALIEVSSQQYVDMYDINVLYGLLPTATAYNTLSNNGVSLSVSSDGVACFMTESAQSLIMGRCDVINGVQIVEPTSYPGLVGVARHDLSNRVFATTTDGRLVWYDMRPPSNSITYMSEMSIGGTGERGLGIHGDYLYMCMGGYGLVIVSIIPTTPAPDTSAPDTPAPDTPAPDTSAPDTSAPDTPAPDTSAPDTPAPDTPAPDTSAPDTSAPDTPAPDTSAPDTSAPDTPAPDTTAPDTPAPDTPAPDTPAPDTPAPDTSAPNTPAPDTPAPDTSAPDTPAPDTSAPDTPAPDTSAPDTPAPNTSAPATQPPDTPAPDTGVPLTSAPDTTPPVTAAPATSAPDTPAPLTQAPATTAPDTVAPNTQPPRTDAPDTVAPLSPFPDTLPPSTVAPSTPAPKTDSPATPFPGTLPPDTSAPLTSAPKTDAPDTVAPLSPFPDTLSPSTVAPSTAAPNTDSPATPFPDTLPPDTSAPFTSAPKTDASDTVAPVTPFPDTLPPSTAIPITSAPRTNAPTTQAPETPPPHTFPPSTDAPATQAPATQSPRTSAPDTFSPQTLAPRTTAPHTPPPDTPAPRTSSPDTFAPKTATPTAAPGTEAPAVVKEEQINTAGSVAAVTSVAAAGAAAGAATRLVVVSQGCLLNGKQKLPRALHPTQMEIAGSEAVGLVIGNFAIIAGFTALCFVVLQAVSRWGPAVMPRLLEGLDTQGLLRFPSVPLFVFQLLYQGTTLGSLNLVVHPPHAGGFLVGVLSMCVCVIVPLLVFRVMTRDVPWAGVYMPEPDCGQVRELFIGPGEWVSTSSMNHWINRYGSVVRTYKQEVVWFSFIEFSASLAISGIQAAETDTYTGCGHKKVFTAIIFFVLLAVEAVVWPHARPRDNVLDFTMLGVQGAAMLLMSVGYYEETTVHWTFDVASDLLMASVVVLLAKVVMDLCSEGYIFFSGRRRTLQDAMFIEKKEPQSAKYVKLPAFHLPPTKGNARGVSIDTFLTHTDLELSTSENSSYFRYDARGSMKVTV